MAQADREILATFVSDLERLLAFVAEDPSDLIHVPRREALASAWAEILEGEGFSRLQTDLREPVDPQRLDQDLRDRGLTGAQLKAKVEGFTYWFERARQRRSSLRGGSRRRGRRERKPVRRALNWANIILGSLISIASLGAVGDLIKEMNDLFLESAEDREG